MDRDFFFILVIKCHSFQHFCVIIALTSFFEVSQEHSLNSRVFFTLGAVCTHNDMEQLYSKTDLPQCKSGSLSGSHKLCYQMDDIGPTMTARLSKTERDAVLFHLWQGKNCFLIFSAHMQPHYPLFLLLFLCPFIKLVSTVLLVTVVLCKGICLVFQY